MPEPSSSFTTRTLTTSDLPALLEVYRSCEDFLALGPVATASLDMVRQDMAHSAEMGGEFCGIFDSAGTLLGVIDFVRQGFEDNPQHAFITLLMIARPYRGKGLGTAIVARIEAEIRCHAHVNAILSGVQVNNPAAIRFWQRMGFTIESEAEALPDGTTAYRLRKSLT